MAPLTAFCALALLLALAAPPARAIKVNVACEGLTVDSCIECSKKTGAPAHQCYVCNRQSVPVWSADGRLIQCKPATTGAACTGATGSGDPNCLRCDGVFCVECRPGYYFDANFKCTGPANYMTPAGCKALSKNAACGTCNPDGSCNKCADASQILVPLNAIYINVAFQETQCMSLAALNAEAIAIRGAAPTLPAGCVEVDSEFQCARCRDGQSLTGGACLPMASGSKCTSTALPYRWYCASCDATGAKCVQCNGARSPPTWATDGRCVLPCRQLYGMGCKRCSQVACLERDGNYAQGRK